MGKVIVGVPRLGKMGEKLNEMLGPLFVEEVVEGKVWGNAT